MENSSPTITRAVSLSEFEASLRLLHDHIAAIDLPEALSYLDVTAASLQAAFTGAGAGLFLGKIDGVVAGMFAYSAFGRWCAQLNYFYISPMYRGRGLGRALVSEVLADSKAQGYFSAILSTLPKLTAARAIYRSFGFVQIPPAYPDLPDAEYYLRTL